MTNTIPTFNPAEYVTAIEDHARWAHIAEGLKKNPNDPSLKQNLGVLVYNSPNAFITADPTTGTIPTPDVLQTYANAGVSDSSNLVQKTTIDNSKRILTDIVGGFSKPEDSLGLLLRTGLMPFEGDDRYKTTTAAHKSVVVAKKIIEEKDVGSAAIDIVKEYEFGQSLQEAVRYHANANPNGLLNIYASSVYGAKIQKLAQEFVRKEDGALKKKHLVDYAQYAFENAGDKSKPAQAIAGIAYGTYKN